MRSFVAILVLMLTFPSPAFAQEGDEAERYEAYLGEAMRSYVEGRYDDALDDFYRAFALQQSAFTLKFIARSHDFTGNCSARASAVDLLGDLFPRASAPPPQRCAEVGELELRCASRERVVVDDSFRATCGTTVLIPAGRHTVHYESLGLRRTVTIDVGGRAVAAFLPPAKWDAYRGRASTNLVQDPDMPQTFEVRKWIARP